MAQISFGGHLDGWLDSPFVRERYSGVNLRELRKEAKLTLHNLAEFTGITHQAIMKWERGQCYPTREHLVTLILVFAILAVQRRIALT